MEIFWKYNAQFKFSLKIKKKNYNKKNQINEKNIKIKKKRK